MESNRHDPSSTDLTPTPAEAHSPSLARRIFFGPFGLRAGWGILIYLLILFTIQRSVNAVHHHIVVSEKQAAAASGKPLPPAPKPDPNAPQPIAPLLIVEGILAATVLLISWLMAFIEHRRIGVFGFGGQHSLKYFLTGTLWGLLALSLLVAALHALHLLVFDAQVDHGPGILGWGATLLFGFLLVGILEESVFRGYLQFTLTRGFVGLGSLISVFLAGMVFVIALWRTGSLWWALGFHMSWDWAQSFLYGVPDSGNLVQGRLFATHPLGNPILSGGTVGPEGSVLIIPILCLVIIVLLFTKRSPQPSLELSDPQSSMETTPVIA